MTYSDDLTEVEAQLVDFVTAVNSSEQIWVLGAQDGGFVVVDSAHEKDTDVLLFWSEQRDAKAHCVDEWADFSPQTLSREEFLDYWVEELAEDNALLGINWTEEQACLEVTAIDLAKALSVSEQHD